MKTYLAILLLVVFTCIPQFAHADPQDTATAVTGAFAAYGLLTQVSTHSKVDVSVDVFSPPETEEKAFHLDHGVAIHNTMARTPMPTSRLVEIWTQLKPYMGQIQDATDVLSRVVRNLAIDERSPDSLKSLAAGVSSQVEVAREAESSWSKFNTLCASFGPNATSTASNEAQTALNVLIERLQAVAAFGTQGVHKLTDAEFSVLQLFTSSAIRQVGTDAGLPDANTDPICTAFKADSNPGKKLSTRSEQVGALTRAYDLAIDAIQMKAPDAKVKTSEAVQAMDEIFDALRGDISGMPNSLTQIAKEALDGYYRLFLGGVNTGPIVNEAMQQVLTKSKAIDVVMDPRNENCWRKEFGAARSFSRMGNHNAIIYLDNMATPVLKTADFDPGDFIAANGKLYQKAFVASASVFGIPSTSAAGAKTGTAPTATNVFDLRKQRAASQREIKASQLALVEALRSILSESVNSAGTNTSAAQVLHQAASKLTK